MTDYRLTERSGAPFEGRVADVYRALGYHVVPNTELPGKQTDLIALRQVEGAPGIVLAIECKSDQRPVGNGEVLAFCASTTTLRAGGRVTAGAMVSSNGFTKDARAAAEALPYVTLLSWAELTSLVFNVNYQMRSFVATYEASSIFRTYLSLSVENVTWATGLTAPDDKRSLDDLLRAWLRTGRRLGSSASTLLVLADFGSGKTTLLRRMQYETATAYIDGEDQRVPLFVPLRDYRARQDLTSLLCASFRESYYRDVPGDLLWQRINDGQCYVLLDGFDEMAERSDAVRRTELFHELLPVLRSRSPSILTSRPSYFVEYGEVQQLMAALRDHEERITRPGTDDPGKPAAADRLRRRLVARHREVAPGIAAHEQVDDYSVDVVRLRRLQPEQVKDYVRARGPELVQINATPEALLSFIRRTYDLTDLASRPMLLALIFDSVIEGGLDVHDETAQLGPSGLYEAYTRAKLDLDLAKGRSRHGGLPLEARRALAQALAMRMYQAGVLEIDFADVVADMWVQDGMLSESGLTAAEVATDFATCSFVTLNQDGSCRFIHKSFRGFFVARELQHSLSKTPKAFSSEPVEWEVLYFLGGFAPTNPWVGERLWAIFKHSALDAKVVRRNALVAYLYTRPDHDSRRVADAEVSDAEFGRLTFSRARMHAVRWRNCTIQHLVLETPKWTHVTFADSYVGRFRVADGSADIAAHGCVVERLELSATVSRLKLERCDIDHAEISGAGTTSASLRETHIKNLRVNGSIAALSSAESDRSNVESLVMTDSHVQLGAVAIGNLRAMRSILAYGGPHDDVRTWHLQSCVVVLGGSKDKAAEPQTAPRRVDDRSIVVVEETTSIRGALLAALTCGIFGRLGAESRVAAGQTPTAWGVVAAEDRVRRRKLADKSPGYRDGAMLFVRESWFERETRGGRLAAVGELAKGISDPSHNASADDLMRRIRAQYDEVMGEGWPRGI